MRLSAHATPTPRGFACLAVLVGSLGLALVAPSRADEAGSAPYLHVRDGSLGYHGVAEDFVDLSEIRVGWFGPSDPDDPEYGDFWWAANLAVEEANAQAAGTDPAAFTALPIRLVPRWAPDPWRAGVSLLARMVFDEQPLALLGSVDSASTHLAEQVVAKVNLPLVSPIATDKTATLAGVPWMFSCAPADTSVAAVLVDDLLHATAPTNASCVLIATTDHESRMAAREVAAELARRGLAPEYRFDLPADAAGASETLRTIANATPAAVIIIAEAPAAARITRAVREQWTGVSILGGPSLGRTRFLELAGPAAEGVRFPALFTPDTQDAIAARFAARFSAERHHAPDYSAALAYDATRLLIEAIRRAGPNRGRIREVLTQLGPWSGIAGPITFDGTGQNRRRELRLGTIRDGHVVALPATEASLPPFSQPATP